ncbi:hypothetical protein [Dyadobacter luticola]|uniref:Uncharacterized protein n=1 Tax=Dyadobacter luticola TaxID=1979387 RepID=A0A5R9L1E6_9BACT|nr:hypothetical protein [Dyadobacter luticola]TLV02197.1 hypothetical protein FEN17_00720 [Dyadobacter luticola]
MKKENRLVIKLLDALAAKHSNMSFVYGFHEWANQHVIEVTPKECFEDDQYVLDEAFATKQFVSKFPYQGILFLSEDPYIKVENPIYDSTKRIKKIKTSKRSAAPGIFQPTPARSAAK